MPELEWEDVRVFFDPDLMGALPDVSVSDATVEDWQAVFDLVRSCDWAWEYSEGGAVVPWPSAEQVLWGPVDADTAELRVWPTAGVLAIFRPVSKAEIDFDIDLRELQGQEGVDTLCDFLGVIGRRLDKPVLMTPEGDYGNPVLGFDPVAGRVILLAHQSPCPRGAPEGP
jgi:hypothetical protein